jgi:hypothetical protein
MSLRGLTHPLVVGGRSFGSCLSRFAARSRRGCFQPGRVFSYYPDFQIVQHCLVVPDEGFEPSTFGLQNRCSTN